VQHVPNGTHLLGLHLHVFLDLRSVIVHQLLALINRRICHGVFLPDAVQRASFRLQEWTVALRPWTASMLEKLGNEHSGFGALAAFFEETTSPLKLLENSGRESDQREEFIHIQTSRQPKS
jgi:hypothetical protein